MEVVEKRSSKIQSFIFLFLIPLLFTVILSLVLMQRAGINVVSQVKEISQKIPGVSSFVIDESENEKITTEERLNKNIENLQLKMEEKDSTIDELNMIVQEKENEISSLDQELKRVKFELTSIQQEQHDDRNIEVEITKLYETMTPKKAALIIPNLEDAEAKLILSSLKTNTLAAILERMSPEDAAKFTKLLAE
ncbi:MotE family protein [Bacillus sp. PS06]|uniref:MotE family protein n=1 Tax=Bacillus sp. PS06 TaxID=2764176 RepID=UPI0017876543|nr:MotE family protein [Bacillus sp. PS06]MBD8068297.1 MotE family protein [Bacillus sp. PS06]